MYLVGENRQKYDNVVDIWPLDIFKIADVIKKISNTASSDLQPYYGNGVFSNVYLLALDDTKK